MIKFVLVLSAVTTAASATKAQKMTSDMVASRNDEGTSPPATASFDMKVGASG